MTEVFLCNQAKVEVKEMSLENQKEVSQAFSLLEIDDLRKDTMFDLCVPDETVYGIVIGRTWIGFRENGNGVEIIHVSLRSKFRPF